MILKIELDRKERNNDFTSPLLIQYEKKSHHLAYGWFQNDCDLVIERNKKTEEVNNKTECKKYIYGPFSPCICYSNSTS